MGVSRRRLLAGSASALWLSACGGGSDSGDDTAPPGTGTITWSVASRGPRYRPLSWVCRGNGATVATGSNGIGRNASVFRAISRRTESGDWIAKTVTALDEYSDINGMTFGNGRFVVITSQGEILTSRDGQTWSLAVDMRANGDYVELFACTFGNGKFVVTGNRNGGTSCWTSSDGSKWSDPLDSGANFQSAPIAFANGNLYAFSGSLFTSADMGATWRYVSVTVGGKSVWVNALAYGEGLYVAVAEESFIATSPDLASWTIRAELTDPATVVLGATYLQGYFFVLAGRTIFSSPDGITWTEWALDQATDYVQSIAFDGTRFVGVGDAGLTVEGTIS